MLKRCLAFCLCLSSVFPLFGRFAAATTGAPPVTPQATVQAATLLINEYLADPPDGLIGDANGDGSRSASQDEFVELVNYGPLPLSIGGFIISDAAQDRFAFPAGKIIPAGESAVVFGGGRPTGSFGNATVNGLVFASSGLSLNNGADSIIIKDSSGIEVARRNYPAADGSANQSITLSPDVTGSFVRHSTATGSGGALFSPGTRVSGTSFSDGPRITRISPAEVLQSNSPFEIDVQGLNFDPSALVFVDFVPVPTNFLSGTSLTATISAAIASSPGGHRLEVVNPDGNHSNPMTLTIVPPPPELFALSPASTELGSGPLTLILQGDHFTPLSKVLVDGAAITTFFGGARQLLATMPLSMLNSLGIRRIRVRNGDGQLSPELPFEIFPKSPRLTSLNPPQALAGSPSLTLTVNGANFTGSTIVLFNQMPLTTKFISPAALQADIPAALLADVGLRAVSVQSSGGGLSNEIAFRVFAVAPAINAVSPDSAIEGSSEQLLVIQGERFKPGAIVRAIKNSQSSAELEATLVSGERIEARLPAAFLQTTGNLLLRVENPDFGFSNEFVFKVLIKDPLVINEYLADPPDGSAGDANGDGTRSNAQDEFVEIVNRTGQAIDLSGFRLSDADAVRHLFAAATVIPPFEALVVFGGGRPQGKFGNAAENQLVFTASSGGLSLNNNGDVLKLEDAGGRLIQEIRFATAEGNAGESLNRDPDGDGAIFSIHQRVSVSDRKYSPGAKASGEAFTSKPVIDRLAPASIHAGSETFSLTVHGSNFQPGAVVSLARTALPTVYLSASELEARVAAELLLAGGAAQVQVSNPRSEISGTARFLIFDEPPSLTSITPQKTATGAENLEIILRGERFQRAAVVTINDEKVATR